jgi:hypothetical protein
MVVVALHEQRTARRQLAGASRERSELESTRSRSIYAAGAVNSLSNVIGRSRTRIPVA